MLFLHISQIESNVSEESTSDQPAGTDDDRSVDLPADRDLPSDSNTGGTGVDPDRDVDDEDQVMLSLLHVFICSI